MSVPKEETETEVIDRVEYFSLRAGGVWNVVGLLTLFRRQKRRVLQTHWIMFRMED